jgi:hypothetical protein
MRTARRVLSSLVSRIRATRLSRGMTIASPQPDPTARERASAGARVGEGGPGRLLRLAPAVQLALACEPEGSRGQDVWATLPEQTREAVLVVLARLIDAGAVEQGDAA